MRLDLLRRHIGQRADNFLHILVARTLRHDGNAKVREQYLFILAQQHVLRLHIAVNQFAVMRKLQGARYLLDVGQNGDRLILPTLEKELPQRPIRRVIHHEIRQALLHSELQHPDDIGMFQPGNRARFLSEMVFFLGAEFSSQQLDSSRRTQVDMLAQIDLSKATFAEQLD